MLAEKLKNKKVILGSKSPRRSELIKGIEIDIRVVDKYDVEESYDKNLDPKKVPEALALLKSLKYPTPLTDDEILITADTIVIQEDEILEKPKDRDEAIEMLERMSGRNHTVITGVVIRDKNSHESFATATQVWFRKLERQEIEHYVDNYQPYDKAGGYGIQEWIGYVGITKIEGSFYNVMGLPIQTLYVKLEEFLNRYL